MKKSASPVSDLQSRRTDLLARLEEPQKENEGVMAHRRRREALSRELGEVEDDLAHREGRRLAEDGGYLEEFDRLAGLKNELEGIERRLGPASTSSDTVLQLEQERFRLLKKLQGAQFDLDRKKADAAISRGES